MHFRAFCEFSTEFHLLTSARCSVVLVVVVVDARRLLRSTIVLVHYLKYEQRTRASPGALHRFMLAVYVCWNIHNMHTRHALKPNLDLNAHANRAR